MEKKAVIKKIVFVTIILILVALVGFVIIRYQVEGEKSLPYSIEKILVTSRIEADTIQNPEYLWDINLSQPNDIFIYIKGQEENKIGISSIKIDGFKTNVNPAKGNIEVLRPTGELSNLYKLSIQNYKDDFIEYNGGEIDDLKSLQVNNTGGVIGFRVVTKNLGEYKSNEDTEIRYDGTLLNKVGTTIDEVKINISFDITIKTTDKVSYKTTVSLDLPVGDITQDGSSNIVIDNLEDLVFKRV